MSNLDLFTNLKDDTRMGSFDSDLHIYSTGCAHVHVFSMEYLNELTFNNLSQGQHL